ncbi:MAG: Hsp70 family protein, partial [Longicatena sp.]
MAIIGIDLGTTNSLAVAFQQDEVVMIPNVYGDYLTPSVVSVDDDGQIIVGKSAKQRLITHPEDTTYLFKRNMGTKEKVRLKNQEYLPEELSAFVVKQLISDAKTFLKEEVSEVVISVPAYFDNEQRSATKRVGDILGVKVERLINEPSAASIACHYGNKEDEAFVVFDFGGGTLDVSVV